ncbi:Glutamine--fructose-6-phosphate aminotransferase [isomerizing] [Botrimarina colliarenosi]|uniref:Glutamine--fructose-6-phosphate aminotransferase [isomerizing] n=1 Tax=Botrimarina colliarenosi TaxID=2528001 RepID=A0A5C6AIB0_9BACT|nr:glutamine--fructose-6-phosphate transaminase (isomerizing) [Botrimarina colliarenosi]TWT99782.1 Glutamine--fructose-6-phosphate aminotransferase [isomerizing] [Botrimarina colliarenosi]
MCGIVGYIGPNRATDFLLEGLRRLEYRGYDSAGVVTFEEGGGLAVTKTTGRIEKLASALQATPHDGTLGIGHTRWATHGPANDANAHPHLGGDRVLALVHNGVIENYQVLRQKLTERGYVFKSDTDTEAVAHLISFELDQLLAGGIIDGLPDGDDPHRVLVEALRVATSQLRGTYGLAVVFRDYPNVILASRLGSPLVIGVGDGEHFIASDGSPLAGHTDRIVYLADHEIAVVSAGAIRVLGRDSALVTHSVEQLEIDASQVELGGFPHFMLKEIFEQPETIRNAMRGRLDREQATAVFGGLNLEPRQLRSIDRMVLTACGTSWHAAMVAEYMIEEFARLPVEVEYASELRYRNPPMSPLTLLLAITQSGETIDTLAALREMKRKGHRSLAICNVVGSTIAREADGGVYLHAGPEIGVASTKAFTSQCVVLALIALHLGRLRHLSYEAGLRIIDELEALAASVEKALETNDMARHVAGRYAGCDNFLYLGRQYNFPTALEGALKLKEISYIHAEGYPAAEMKHGPIALVDEHTPSVFIVPQGAVYEKVLANMEEIRARGGPVIAIVDEDDERASQIADEVIRVPHVADYLQPIVTAIPLQLLAYHIAVLRGCDVDKPRNLAKSVTVE